MDNEYTFTFEMHYTIKTDNWGYEYGTNERWDLVDGPESVPARIADRMWATHQIDLRQLNTEIDLFEHDLQSGADAEVSNE